MIRVLEANFRALPVKTRMPFRYGIAVLTQVPHFFLELQIEINKQVYKGLAADNLPPKWFVKNPDESFSQELNNMLAVISHACESVTKLEPQTNIFAIWKACYEAQKSWGQAAKHPPLLWQFGVSLVERALIEAFCQAKNRSFANALRSNAFGLNLAYFHSSLKGKHPSEILPENPLVKLHARHTVGLSDPLTDNEILEEDRAKDSLPQSLDATLRHYGIHYLKLKLSGNSEADFNRLESIANLLKALDKEFVFTLDGNEQYSTLSSFKDFWQDLTKKSSMKSFLKRLLFVEQPFSRTIALSENLTRELLEWQDRPAIIIDESDAELGSLARALAGGYMGTSHKNCKGIFKSIDIKLS